MERISFSIVVVCLNPGQRLLSTVESVLRQDYPDFEILIKDGGSRDGSLSTVPEDPRIRLIQKPDRGIYDAMNQALEEARGRYVQFLNCGDVFHDGTVLGRIAKAVGEQEMRAGGRPLIVYGNQYNLKPKCAVESAHKIDDFTCYRNVPCHQVCFYDAALFSKRGYLTRYRVRADYEHFLFCVYEMGAFAVHADVLVADYEGGGFSDTRENKEVSKREHKEIVRRYLGAKKALLYGLAMLLTLAPLRTRLAENEKWAAAYNKVKTGIYRLGKGASERR